MAQTKTVAALGFFDGVHIGHAALLRRVCERAAEMRLEPVVISFDTHPDTLVRGVHVPLINSALDRRGIVSREFGINCTELLHFDREMMQMQPEDFIFHIHERYGAQHLVVGHDFRFGYRGSGCAENLPALCERYAMTCEVIEPVLADGRVVSSTEIRELLADGRLAEANMLLGHPHVLTGIIQKGFRMGHTLNFPTINMRFEENVLAPRFGVYASKVILPEGSFPSVTNIGARPTLGREDVTVESHILHFDRELYGREARVEFHAYLRPEIRFEDVDALQKQIALDAAAAEKFFSR